MRSAKGFALLLPLALLWVGCTSFIVPPPQAPFETTSELVDSGQAVARLYIAQVGGGLGFLATHGWFLTKPADRDSYQRWEVSYIPDGPYEHVRLNHREPTAYVYGSRVFVWAERVGSEAVELVDFIEENAPLYPCRSHYYFYPGPNSNTFIQWMLDEAGWDVALPYTSTGSDWPVTCTPSETRAAG